MATNQEVGGSSPPKEANMAEIRLNFDLNFQAGIWYGKTLLLSNYAVNANIITNTKKPVDNETAVERIRWFTNHVFHGSVFIEDNDQAQADKLWAAGINVLQMPAPPNDQMISLLMLTKLNAIVEGRVVLTDLSFSSNLSDGIRYMTDIEDFMGPFLHKGWWSDSAIVWYDKTLHAKKDGAVTLPPVMTWTQLQLQWHENKNVRPRKGKSNVVSFSKNNDKK